MTTTTITIGGRDFSNHAGARAALANDLRSVTDAQGAAWMARGIGDAWNVEELWDSALEDIQMAPQA
jgi:hypothetical protein